MKLTMFMNKPQADREGFLNELGSLTGLCVAYESAGTAEGGKNYSEIFLDCRCDRDGKSTGPELKKHLKSGDEADLVCFDDSFSPAELDAIAYCQKENAAYIISASAIDGSDGEAPAIARKKERAVSGAAAIICTGRAAAEQMKKYGADGERVHICALTELAEGDLATGIMTRAEKKELREKAGFSCDKMVLSVAQPTLANGCDMLVRAASRLGEQVGFYLVGGQPEEGLAAVINGNKVANLHIIDRPTPAGLNQYYLAADLLIMTASDSWGIAVNEAMANGLPVIATDRCTAATELIDDDKNGYIVPFGDEQTLANRLDQMLGDRELREDMGRANLKKMRDYTDQKAAQKWLSVIQAVKK